MVTQLDPKKDQKPGADVKSPEAKHPPEAPHLQTTQGTAEGATAQRQQIAKANEQVHETTGKFLGAVELTTANGDHLTVQNGKVVQLSDDGKVWASKDGKTFTSGDQTRILQKGKDGNYDLIAAPVTTPEHAVPGQPKPAEAPQPGSPTKPTDKPIDMNEMIADAAAIRKATGNDNFINWGRDKDAINKVLEGKTEAERKAIDGIYKTAHGVSLDQEMAKFESGSDYDKFENLLHKQDTNIENQNARRLHEDLLENQNIFQGRSPKEIEKDVRGLLSTHNSDELAKMDQEYRKEYGKSMRDALMTDKTLSQATKDVINVYLPDPKTVKPGEQFKGTESRSVEDTAKLIDIALKQKDSAMFAESMRDASPAARKAFLEQGGEKRIDEAFDHWYSDKDVRHAMDYAREGQLSASLITDNTHLINNTKGIELAIKDMTADERKRYQIGKDMAAGKTPDGVSADDQQSAKTYYDSMHDALKKAGSDTDVNKWEDMIASDGQSNFVSNLADHQHKLWFNDSTADVSKDIENMSNKDWDDCRQHPERRDELKTMLESLNKPSKDVDAMLAIYDKKMAAKDYNEAKDAGRRSVLQDLDDNSHWYGTDRKGTLDSIYNMSGSDQQRYRTDESFRQSVDKKIDGTDLEPDALDSAHRMLKQIQDGKEPKSDPISQLERIDNLDGASTGDAVRLVEKAFRDDPSLRERVLHPQTDDDRKYSEQFKQTVQNTLGDDFEVFGKPLVEQGNVPLELKMHLNQDVFSNDYDKSYQDLQNATPAEKERLKNDAAYRQETIGFMDAKRQQIAMAVLDQQDMHPADQLRSALIGWGGSADIIATLKNVKPEDLDSLKQEYVQKYGSSLEGDVYKKLGGDDRAEAERAFAKNLSAEEQANIATELTERARSGVGSAIADHVWNSGTGAQADDAQERTNRAISDQAKLDKAISDKSEQLKNMTPEQLASLKSHVANGLMRAVDSENTATENHVEAKKAAAEYATDTAIAAVAIGSMIATGGADTPLVLALAVAGAGIKVGGTALLEGDSYDWSVSNVAKDALVGSVSAATSVIGPGEVAAVFGVGKQAAQEAASIALTQIGEDTLKEGGADLIAKGTQQIVADALASGAKKLETSSFEALAEKAISSEIVGDAREAAVHQLATSLEKNVTERMGVGIVRTFTQHALNAGGGALGGGAGGFIQGSTEYDSRLGLKGNAEHVLKSTASGAFSGAVGGAGASVVLKSVGEGVQVLRTALKGADTPIASIAPLERVAGDATDAVHATTADVAVVGTGAAVVNETSQETVTETTKGVLGEGAKQTATVATPGGSERARTELPHSEIVPSVQPHDEVPVVSHDLAPMTYTPRPVGGEDIWDPRIPETIDSSNNKIKYSWEDHNGTWRANKVVDQGSNTTFKRVAGTDNQWTVTDAGGKQTRITADIDVANNGNYVVKNETTDAAQQFAKKYTGPGGESWQPEPGSTLERNRLRGDYWTSPSGAETWVDNKGVIWQQSAAKKWESAQGTFTEGPTGGARWDWNDGRTELITTEGMGALHDPKTMAAGEFRTADGGIYVENTNPEELAGIARKSLIPDNYAGEPSSKFPSNYFDPPANAVYEGKDNGFDTWRAADGTKYQTGEADDSAASAIRTNPDGTSVWKDVHGRAWERVLDADGSPTYKYQNEFGTYESSFDTKGTRWTWKDGSADWLDTEKRSWHRTADMPEGEWHGTDGSVFREGSGQYDFRFVGDNKVFTVPSIGLASVIGSTQAAAQTGYENDSKAKLDAKTQRDAEAKLPPGPEHKSIAQASANPESETGDLVHPGEAVRPGEVVQPREARPVPPTQHLDQAAVNQLWDKQASADGVFKFQKGYYEANLAKVDPATSPNGIIFSSSESTIKVSQDVTLPSGQVLKAGTELPNGVQLSPGNIEVGADGTRTLTGVKLTTPPDGVRLADGTTLKSGEIKSIKISDGDSAKPNEYIIQRASTDDAGHPRIDTYAQDEAMVGRKWVPVDGKPGVYSPNIGNAGPMEMVKIPDNMRVKFLAEYGKDVSNKEPAYLVSNNGGHYLITERDLRETYVGSDPAGNARMKQMLRDASDVAGVEVPRAIKPVPPTQHLDQAAVNQLWDKQVSADGVFKFQKGYYEANLAKVDPATSPNGIIFSSSESTIKVSQDVTLPSGQVLKAGTELPNGVQLSPGNIEVGADGTRTLTGVKLTTPPDGVRLADGTTLKSGEIKSIKISDGDSAKPNEYIIQRASTDDAGHPRIDTYAQDEAMVGRKWVPVDGKPGVYSPNIGNAGPMEMVKIPDNMRVKFLAEYGKDVSNQGPAYLVSNNGGHYLITERDLRETYVASDGSSELRMRRMLDDASAESGIRVPSAVMPEGKVPYLLDVKTPKEDYIKTATVRAEMVNEDGYKWTNHDAAPGNQEQIAKKGDYIIHPPDGSAPYVAEGDFFRSAYHDMPGYPGHYAKNVPMKAQVLEGPASVNNPTQGVTSGKSGDYLVTDAKNNQYIVPKDNFEAQYAPQVAPHGRIEPMNLPTETSPKTDMGDGVLVSSWDKGDIVRNTKQDTVLVQNNETGEFKYYRSGRLLEERRVVESAEGKKVTTQKYPYEDVDSVHRLPSPDEYNQVLLKTEYKGRSLADVKNEALSMPDTLTDPTIDRVERENLQKFAVEDRWKKLLSGEDATAQEVGLGPPKQEKKARILMGLTGSGKTSAGMSDLKGQGYMVPESDELKPYFPEYKGGVGANALRNESNKLNDDLVERAIKGGYNFVLPGVGTNAKWTTELIQHLHEAGWKVDLVFVDIPPAESMTRVVNRFQKMGRFVDPGFLVTHGNLPAQNYRKIVDDTFVNGSGLNSYKHIWNYGSEAVTLEEGKIE